MNSREGSFIYLFIFLTLDVGSSNSSEASFFFCMFTQWQVQVPVEALIFFNIISVIFTSLFLLLSEIVARDLYCKCIY